MVVFNVSHCKLQGAGAQVGMTEAKMQMRQAESHKIKSPATNLIPVSLPSFLFFCLFTLHLLCHSFLSLPLCPHPLTGSVSLQQKGEIVLKWLCQSIDLSK